MLSGRRLDIVDPSPLDIEIEDIALGLARIARWNGQTLGTHGFSVAQHCVVVVRLMRVAKSPPTRPMLLAGLLHDAPEYVVSDIVSPFKRIIGDAYSQVEAAVERAVHLRFGLPAELPASWRQAIKRADMLAAYAEAVQLAGFAEAEAKRAFGFSGEAPKVDLTPWDPEKARAQYLKTFLSLAA